MNDINNFRALLKMAMDQDFVKKPPMEMLEGALARLSKRYF